MIKPTYTTDERGRWWRNHQDPYLPPNHVTVYGPFKIEALAKKDYNTAPSKYDIQERDYDDIKG